jgi:Ankyrin repeat
MNILLDHGAEVDPAHIHKSLYIAAAEGRKRFVEMLIRRGANLNVKGGSHGSALRAAAYHHHPLIIRCLLEAGSDLSGADCGCGPSKLNLTSPRVDSKQQKIIALLTARGWKDELEELEEPEPEELEKPKPKPESGESEYTEERAATPIHDKRIRKSTLVRSNLR